MSQSPENMSVPTRVAVGGATAVTGLAIIGMAGGVIPVDPSTVHAPSWVIFTAGGLFALVGLWIASTGSPLGDVLNWVVGPAAMVGLMSILHWVAFGPGVRQCSGGISIPFLSSGGPVGDLECRLAFGYGAMLLDGVLGGAMLSSWAEERLTGTLQRVATGVGSALILIPLAPFLLLVIAMGLVQAAWAKVRGS